MRVGIRQADVLIALFQSALRHRLDAAGIGDAEDMRIRRAVDALKQVGDFPNHQRRATGAITRSNIDLRRLPAPEQTQLLLRCLEPAPRTSRTPGHRDSRALISHETTTPEGPPTRWR